MLKNTFRWRAQKNAAVKAKNGYKYASLPRIREETNI
ncbi:conserved hypothetical protein [Escherichia coli TA271]|nr:conserved hypothetical protein [Escherichia coli TA271]EGI45304.1 conserved hypothetical protein [Escherichia coli H591]EGJ04895.1 hypothetical protein SSJG_00943 [Escherichia coli D9]